MNKRKRINKKTLIDLASSSLDEEFGPMEFNEPESNISENNETNPKKENYKPEGPRYNKVRDKGDWEQGIYEAIPVKRTKDRDDILEVIPTGKTKNRVDIFKKLPNGLTPHEMMYGKKDNDSDYLNKMLD